MKSILVYRNFDGFGDWIMAMSVLKMLQAQRNDVKLYLNTYIGGKPMDAFLLNILLSLDVMFEDTLELKKPEEENPCDVTSGHMVYPRRYHGHLIEGMAYEFMRRTGIDFEYVPGMHVQYQGEVLPCWAGNYIVMPSQGRRVEQWGKEWGADNFIALASRLSAHVPIMHIARPHDVTLPQADIEIRNPNPVLYHTVLSRARLIVSQVNGLMVYTGHHGLPSLVINSGTREERREWWTYPNQTVIQGQRVRVAEVECAVKRILYDGAETEGL